MHWVASAAVRHGLAPEATLAGIAAATPVAEAWAEVARRAGVSPERLAAAIAGAHRLSVADLEAAEPSAVKLVPEKLARRFGVLPLRGDERTLWVATANPTDLEAERDLEFAADRRIVFTVAPPGAIARAIDRRYASGQQQVQQVLAGANAAIADLVTVDRRAATAKEADISKAELESGPVVKLTNLVFADAVRLRASDVHIEPQGTQGVVRFRIDGVLRPYLQMPVPALARVISRIKVLADLDIADHLRPQDGRAKIAVDGKSFDLRVSTVPARGAEKAVIRILRPDLGKSLDETGLGETALQRLRQLLGQRDGIVLITGPTGSGKTTTIYAAIRELATGETNISTVEDPVEYELPGITQIQVEEKQGVTFAGALRALLRQDPDIIFVGEIRDLETAQTAVQAAMTGHLVLATLHTNDAISVVSRLSDIGLDRASIAATLRGALAQRLLRRLCPQCAVPAAAPYTAEEQRLGSKYGRPPTMRAIGCGACNQTGYAGRIPVAEVVIVHPALSDLIASNAPLLTLQRSAIAAGSQPLVEAALAVVAEGRTTLHEVERVIGDPAQHDDGGRAPAAASEGPAVPVAAGRGAGERPSTYVRAIAEAAAGAGPCVLIVDDDLLQRQLCRGLLEQHGFRVTENEDGADALERVHAGEEFDLIVLDLNMPRMDGREFLQRLRQSPSGATVPVIVLTGATEASVEAAVMDDGADDYIRKPFDPVRFVARVKAALRRAGAFA